MSSRVPSIKFLGYNITTETGVTVYRTSITILPLIPIIILLIQNVLGVDDMLDIQSKILETEAKVGRSLLALLAFTTLFFACLR